MIAHAATAPASRDVPCADPRTLPFVLAVLINSAALVLFACSAHAAEYPLASLGIAAFLLVQMLLPACRPNWDAPLCPGNIAQAFFWVQLVLVALLIGRYGIREGTLPQVPSAAAIDTAIALRVVAYLAFSAAYQFSASRRRRDDAAPRERESAPTRPLLIGGFLMIGLLGQGLAYESFGEYLEYVSSPTQHREREAQPTTAAGAASTFLRPFLGFGLVLAWAGWLRRRRRGLPACAAATAGLGVLLLLANFSYNRGSLLAPLVGVAAAYSLHVRRVSVPTIVLGGALALFGALAFGWYRSTDLEIGQLTSADLDEAWSEDQLAEFFQIYASGPQMTAYLIEQRGEGAPLYWGRSLVCSAIYPVPVFGKAFRDGSGVALLNMLIYQDPDNVDQIIAYDAELYINFLLPGVVLGYGLIGWFLRVCQRRFLGAPHAGESYAWLMLALWTVFPGSLPVLSQMCVYFFWPFYLYFAAGWLDRRRPASDGRVGGIPSWGHSES